MSDTRSADDHSLSVYVDPDLPSGTGSKSYTYYHAGPLFTLAELTANTLLARKISAVSKSKFVPVLPQDLEQRDSSPHSIRDQDIRALLSCDLAVFTYDGTELDSGTVIEFMFAKMADIPAVILRTDFRGAGDQNQSPDGVKGDPWNLMSSNYPRTESVVVNSMASYKAALAAGLKQNITPLQLGPWVSEHMTERTAIAVVAGLEKVLKKQSVMPKELRESVYQWLAMMPGLRDGGEQNIRDMLKLCTNKTEKGLL